MNQSGLQSVRMALMAATAVVGCGTSGPQSVAPGADVPPGTSMDVATDVAVGSDAAHPADGCPSANACGGGCSDLMIDTNNCGACGHVCAPPTPYCVAGGCAPCVAGMLACGSACVASNAMNCGTCGTTCRAPTAACIAAVCVVPPPSCLDVNAPGCGWITILGGSFTMGGDALANGDMPTAGLISLSGFTLDAYDVTVARFRRFWAGGHPAATSPMRYPGGMLTWTGGSVTEPLSLTDHCDWTAAAGTLEAHPITCVDWYTAQAFCAWDGGRLPTEAEWEYAARGMVLGGLTPERAYPWSNRVPSATCDLAEWNACAGDDGTVTKRVGSHTQNAGLYDLAGNVWEWSADWYAPYGDTMCWSLASQRDPVCGNAALGNRVVRGGSWHDVDVTHLRSASRDFDMPVTQDNDIGFRCVRSL